jgi:23S rRNA pseudouridine955/2504/2580 synthase
MSKPRPRKPGAARSVTIGRDEQGQRLDRFLRKLLHDVSLSAIYRLLRTRRITLNHRKAKPDTRLNSGDVVTLYEAAHERHLQPKAARATPSMRRDFQVVFADEHLVVVNKPAGLIVHAGDRGDDKDTLIDQVSAWLQEQPRPTASNLGEFVKPSPTFSPGLVHRLDRATSGLVMIGRTLPAMQALTAMIKRRQVRKTYLALAFGGLPAREGEIRVPIARKQDAKGRRRKVEAGQGRASVTRYRVLAQKGHFTLLELELVTGRTHQIRAHLSHEGAPLVGDNEYGDRGRNRHASEKLGLKRQFLHAARLEFQHPITGEMLDMKAELWPDLKEALHRLGMEAPRSSALLTLPKVTLE